MRRHTGPWAGLCLALALVVGACSSGDSDDGAGGSSATPTEAVVATPTVPPTPFPTVDDVPDAQPGVEGAAAGRMAEVIGWLNGEPLDEATYEATFDELFRSQVPFDAFVPSVEQLGAAGPWQIDRDNVAQPAEQESVIVNADRTRALIVSLVVDDGDPALITGLFLQPTTVEALPPATTLGEAVQELDAMGTVRYSIAAVEGGDCSNTLAAQADTESMPVGSAFKLWVLGAVVGAVERGEITWDDPVTIRDELDSIPTGITQDDPDGSTVSVRELASRMISISDNTATDHLMDLVGRSAVEDMQAVMGHADPDANRPMLTTRELTIVKFSGDAELLEDYRTADAAGRRALLDTTVGERELPAFETVIEQLGTPIVPLEIEWFASPRDLCEALRWLVDDPTALEILTEMPFAADPNRWSEMGYKGGSEPGVLATAWWLRDLEGVPYVVVIGLVNGTAAVDEVAALELMRVIRDSTATVTAG